MAVTESLISTYRESDALALADLVHRGEVAPGELVEAAVSVVERLNPALNAVIHKLYDFARKDAETVDRAAPFAGVPFLLKELATGWAGAPQTNSSRFLQDLVAPADDERAARIRRAGFLLLGKSNAPENGWSISTEPKLYGVTKNPWKDGITPGGSSGGTAAAVAARMVPLAEASDGAGSIRVPASCCGVVGLKPSRGRVSLAPNADYWYGGAYFLCCSRTVRDTAAYLDALAGNLLGEPYTPPVPGGSFHQLSRRAPERLRIGYTVSPPHGRGIDPEVERAVLETVRVLEGLGHVAEEHDMALNSDRAWRTYTDMTSVQTAQAYGWLAQFVGREVTPADVEPVTWAVIERGRSFSGIDHATQIEAVRVMGREVVADLDRFDVFITPTLTREPRPLGFYDMSMHDLDAYNALWSDSAFMFPFNMSGQPAISLPLGWSTDGVPIGVQMVGRYGDEAGLLALSACLEEAMPWRGRKPAISA